MQPDDPIGLSRDERAVGDDDDGSTGLRGSTKLDEHELTGSGVELPGGLDPDALGVEARAELKVVTTQSLGDVARWIAGGKGGERSAISRNLIGAVADDLSRSAEATCAVKAVK